MKKYKLTNTTQVLHGRRLHQIQALRSFGPVQEGELGGWIQSEKNLSHDGLSWVSESGTVYDNAQVFDDAQIRGAAWVHGNARVYNIAQIYGSARVFDEGQVYGEALVYGHALIFGCSKVFGNAQVYEEAWILDEVQVFDDAQIKGTTVLFHQMKAREDVRVSRNSQILSILNYQKDEDAIPPPSKSLAYH